MRVLLLGATGGCGSQVLTRLLSRDVETTVIVRDEERLPEGAKANPLLRVIVEPRGHLALSNSDFADAIKTVDAVISCLGHTLTLSGVFGHPRRLCRDTTAAVFDAARALAPARPLKYIVVSTEGVDHPAGADAATLTRGSAERCLLWLLSWALPPHADNMSVVDYLHKEARGNPHVEFVAVRPSDMVDADESAYELHATLQNGIFDAGTTSRANVGAFMADLATDKDVWDAWRGTYPQILDAKAKSKDA